MTLVNQTSTYTIELTEDQAQMVANALVAVSPSGGNSPTYNLFLNILGFIGNVDDQMAAVVDMQVTAAKELPSDVLVTIIQDRVAPVHPDENIGSC